MNTLMYDTYTIFWREIKRYKKSRSGVLIRLIQPAIWIIVIGNTFSGTQPLIQSVGFQGDYIEFMTPGVIILTAIFTSIFGGVNTLWDRRYGFMNKALTSPISRSAIALGKMSAISLISALQASLIIGIALAIGVNFPNPIMIAPIMVIVILFSLGFSGISVMVAATAKSQETITAQGLVDGCQLLEGAELCELCHEGFVFDRIKRVLILQLQDQQPQECILTELRVPRHCVRKRGLGDGGVSLRGRGCDTYRHFLHLLSL